MYCFLRENVAGGPRGLHPCWGPGRRGDTALELGEGPAVFPHGHLAGRANFAEMRVHTRLHRHRHSGTCACVSVQHTNVCVHTCLRVRVCSCQAGKGKQMLSCPKPCTDTSQGLFFGDREGGRTTCAQAQGAGLGVNALDPLSPRTSLQTSVTRLAFREGVCGPEGLSTLPRAPSGSAGGLGVGTRATVRDARGPRRTALPGLGRGPPPRPPGGRVWVGRAVLGPLSGPPRHGPRCAPGCPGRDRPSRCGRAVSGVPPGSEETVLTSAPSVLSFHVRSSPGLPAPTRPGPAAAAGTTRPPDSTSLRSAS